MSASDIKLNDKNFMTLDELIYTLNRLKENNFINPIVKMQCTLNIKNANGFEKAFMLEKYDNFIWAEDDE